MGENPEGPATSVVGDARSILLKFRTLAFPKKFYSSLKTSFPPWYPAINAAASNKKQSKRKPHRVIDVPSITAGSMICQMTSINDDKSTTDPQIIFITNR